MSPSPLSSARCTKGGTASRRWIIAALVVALIGLGVPAFADSTSAAKKIQAAKAVGPKSSDDAAVNPTVGSSSNDSGGRSSSSPLAPPSNDDCSGALVLPDGPYPMLTPAVNAIDATPQGVDEGIFPCAVAPSSGTDYTVWYSFTPSVSTLYTFTTCPAAGATGNTVLDTVIGIFSSTGGSCPAVTNLACADSSSCATAGDYSTISAVLTAGETYFLVAGNWQPGGGLAAGNSTYQVLVSRSNAPPNDTCAGAIDLPLNRIVQTSTAGANDDYQVPSGCFSDGLQNPTNAPGRDTVFTFTAPSTGKYSIRQVPAEVNTATVGMDTVLYATSGACTPGLQNSCILAANRETLPTLPSPTGTNNNRGEELHCLSLTAGQTIHVFVDYGVAANDGGIVGLEATPCQDEVEPNDAPATASEYNFGLCGNNEGFSSYGPTAHCVLGTNPGASCIVRDSGSNVNADCGPAANGGLCFYDSVCVGGPTPGAACTPTCVGGSNPGAACSGLAGQCLGGGACATSGGCGQCVNGPTPGAACTANSQCGSGGTCNAGTCDRTANEGDVDFWHIGNLSAGQKVWTAISAVQANDMNFRMRVTDSTQTLGFDDDDGMSVSGGSTSSVIAGSKATGGDTYVRVSRTTGWQSGPYRLYTAVSGPISAAQAEVGDGYDRVYGWPADGIFAPYLNNGANTGLVRGSFGASGDEDCLQMIANEGDEITWWGDSNPDRVDGNTPGIPQFIIYDAAGAAISNFVFTTGVVRSTGPHAPQAGLTLQTPQDTSFFNVWRARYSGTFLLCAYPFANTNLPALGPYPKPYAGYLSVNCQAPRPAGPGTTTTDVSVTKTGPAGPLPTSSIFQYTITVTNSNSDIAQNVELVDNLPAEVLFLGLSVDDGFGGNQTACASLPTPGTADAPIDCTNISMAPGSSTVYTITAQVANCIGDATIENTATIQSISTDPNPANDTATWSFNATANSACTDLLCDSTGCIESLCTVNDHCDGGVCVSDPKNCDDNSVCTDDSCDIATGNCINDGTPGSQCDDGNPCTQDLCDPVQFCVFPPAAAGVACDDFFGCTHDDACDGQGNCAGISVCADNNPCTDDFADEGNNCACSYAPSYEGAPCSDGNACTTNDACDGAENCVGGAAPNCDDSNACTDDSCDPQSGCVNTNNTASCDDGNACTSGDACADGACAGGGAVNCDDNNPCTDDSCDPQAGCVHTPNTNACDDGNACTSGDTCGGGTCNGGAAVVCNDGNGCTDDSCNPASGCEYTNNTNACDDGNACTTGDTCGGGSCQAGSAVVCNDDNACTDDSCNPASGCVYTNNTNACDDGNACTVGDTCGGGSCNGGAPVVCSASDQCHAAGVCNPADGVCSNPTLPDGTACDDGNSSTSNDSCQAGVCTGGSSCTSTNDPKTWGWYHSLCTSGGHSGDSITNADAACVAASSPTFSGISSASQVCDVLDPSHGNNGPAAKAQKQEMTLLLNICKQRICPSNNIEASCGAAQNVGQAQAQIDAVLANPNSTSQQLGVAECQATEINDGRALMLDSLKLGRESGGIRLTWIAPTINNGTGSPKNYTIWRRVSGSGAAFVKIGTVTSTSFLDTTTGTSSWDYLLKVVY